MIILTFLLFIPLIASGSIDNGLEIINGEDARRDEFPHIVSLRRHKRHVCGGSLISPYWVLTAAHCLSKCPNTYQVVYSSIDSFNEVDAPSQNLRNVTRYIIHEKFKLGFFTHDIGLVQLAEYIILPNYMQLSDVPRAFNTTVTAAGWGLNEYWKFPRRLQKIDLIVYDDKKCNASSPSYYYPTTEMCAGSAKGGTCLGDSGGHVIYNNVQYGIVSYGDKYCTLNNPVFFTKVAPLRSWIRQHAEV